MTVATLSITDGPYAGNDVADSFAYNFKINDTSELSVYEKDDSGVIALLKTTDYTVSGAGNPSGGSVTRVAGALPTGYTWVIRAAYTATQNTAFASQGGFFPDVHEHAFDKLSYIAQQHDDLISRSIRQHETDDVLDMRLPSTADRLDTVLAFDAATGKPVVGPTISAIAALAALLASTPSAGEVVGISVDGNGVTGTSTNFFGVEGNSVNNVGIVGNSTNGNGIEGYSVNGAGIVGISENGTGIVGGGESGIGVLGNSGSGTGIVGNSGSGTGVAGSSMSGTGVAGSSTTGYGVSATSTGGEKAPLLILPSDEPTGYNDVGALYVTAAGELKICTVAGTPGTWEGQVHSSSGTFTLTGTGFTVEPTTTVEYVKFGRLVHLFIPRASMTGISNSTSFVCTGIPYHLQPVTDSAFPLCEAYDNGTLCSAAILLTGTTLVVSKGALGQAWTGSGVKNFVGSEFTYLAAY